MPTASQQRLLALHREIDLVARTTSRQFISGWETAHRVRYECLQPLRESPLTGDDPLDYRFMSDDAELKDKLRQFHRLVDGTFPTGADIFLGAGSSPLVSAIMLFLSIGGEKEVHYIKPIYHAYYYLAKALGIRMNDVGDALTDSHETRVAGRLPERKSVLLVTDPSWISGRSLSEEFWQLVRAWQMRTNSLVIVDGTFQYTKWEAMTGEHSSVLDPHRTLRLVCPTKSLCVHGVRFAYLLLPHDLTEDLGYVYCKLVAGTSALDIRVAHLMADQLLSPRNNRELTAYAQDRYVRLLAEGLIRNVVVEPNCTYYAYGISGCDPATILAMNGEYFELDYAPELIRINILSPALEIPGEAQP